MPHAEPISSSLLELTRLMESDSLAVGLGLLSVIGGAHGLISIFSLFVRLRCSSPLFPGLSRFLHLSVFSLIATEEVGFSQSFRVHGLFLFLRHVLQLTLPSLQLFLLVSGLFRQSRIFEAMIGSTLAIDLGN